MDVEGSRVQIGERYMMPEAGGKQERGLVFECLGP